MIMMESLQKSSKDKKSDKDNGGNTVLAQPTQIQDVKEADGVL